VECHSTPSTGLNKPEIPDLRLHDLPQQNVHADLFLVQLVSKTNTLYPIYRTRCKKSFLQDSEMGQSIHKIKGAVRQVLCYTEVLYILQSGHEDGLMNIRYFLISYGVKTARCEGMTLPPSWAHCLEIWEPQPPGTLRACPGLYWDCLTFTFLINIRPNMSFLSR